MKFIALGLALVVLGSSSHAQDYALEFGDDGHVEFPYDPIMNTGNAATFEVWARFPAGSDGTLELNRYQPSREHKGLVLRSDGAIEGIYAGSPWPQQATALAVFPRDWEFHHVAFVRHPSSTFEIYLDGRAVLQGGPGPCWLTCGVINGTAPTVLQVYGAALGSHWQVREVRISGTDRYAGAFVPAWSWASDSSTALLLHLDEGAGNVVRDDGPAGQTGTITGTTSWVPVLSVGGVLAQSPGTTTVLGTGLDEVTEVLIGGAATTILSQSPTALLLHPAPQDPGRKSIALVRPSGTTVFPCAVSFWPTLDASGSGVGGTLTTRVENGGPGFYLLNWSLALLPVKLVVRNPPSWFGLLLDPTLGPPTPLASGSFSQSGTTTTSFPIPKDPALAGTSVYLQGWATQGFLGQSVTTSFTNLGTIVL